MDTVEVRGVSDVLVELVICGISKHTASVETLARSRVLSQALSAAAEDGVEVGTMLVPGGYLTAWLSHVLNSNQATAREEVDFDAQELLTLLKASDFFADESAVRDVSKKVGRMVFEMQEAASRLSTKQRASVSTMLSPHADNKADTSLTNVQQSPAEMIFQQLPQNLVISAIQAGSAGLCKSITLLPPQHHSLALHAHFPSITQSHSLYIPEASLASAVTADVLWPAFKVVGSLTMLQELSLCTPVHARVPHEVLTDFEGAISQLRDLQYLQIEGGLVTNEVVEAVARALTHTRPQIRSLSLHRVGEMQNPSATRPLVLQSSAIFDSLKLCDDLQNVSLRYITCRRGADEGEVLSPATLLSAPTLTSLTSLTLAHKAITAEMLHQMTQQLSISDHSGALVPQLKALNIRMNRIRDEGVQYLAKLIHSLPSLQNIDVSWNEITAFGSSELGAALIALEALTSLDIGGNLIGDGLPGFAETMREMQSLQHLNMRSCRTLPGDGWMLGALVGRLSNLTFLDLRANSLGGGENSLEGARFLSTSLQQISGLRDLRLSVIDRLYAEALAILLLGISLQSELHTLQIKSSATFTWRLFWPDQVAVLESVAHHMSKLTKLQRLSLDSGVQFSPGDARALTAALPISLRTLQLQFMPGAESQQELGAALSKLTALEDLNLSVCGFTESTAAALSAAIVCMHGLTRLCLKGNNLKDGGAIELATALKNLRNLLEVDLSDTGLSEVGAIAVVGAVDVQGTVTTCWLQDNKIKRNTLPKRSRGFTVVLGSTSQEIAIVSSTSLA